jgi:hypothetical protein
MSDSSISDRVFKAWISTVGECDPLPDDIADMPAHVHRMCERMRRHDPRLSDLSDDVLTHIIDGF